MRHGRLSTVLALVLVVTTCGSCAVWECVERVFTNPVFQDAVCAVAGVFGPQYGRLAEGVFRVFGRANAYYASQRPQAGPIDPSKVKPTDLKIEFTLLKEALVDGRWQAVSIRDGDTLYDLRPDGKKDHYKISLRANQDCYVYVVQLDSRGKLDPLFPRSQWTAAANPVKANTDYFIPASTKWLVLDQNKGIEHFYLLASKAPKPKLEADLDKIIAQNKIAQPVKALNLKEPVVFSRGCGGAEESHDPRQASLDEGKTTAAFQPFVFVGTGDELVETRWFYHK